MSGVFSAGFWNDAPQHKITDVTYVTLFHTGPHHIVISVAQPGARREMRESTAGAFGTSTQDVELTSDTKYPQKLHLWIP